MVGGMAAYFIDGEKVVGVVRISCSSNVSWNDDAWFLNRVEASVPRCYMSRCEVAVIGCTMSPRLCVACYNSSVVVVVGGGFRCKEKERTLVE